MGILTKKRVATLVKYAIVGVMGTTIDVGILYLLVEYQHLPVLVAATLSFIVAVINNFFFNKIWTFQDKSKRYLKQYIKFFIIALISLCLSNLILLALIHFFALWYVAAKLITSACIFIWNFLSHKFWTFSDTSIPRTRIPVLDYPCQLSIIIPTFNEAANITQTLQAVTSFLEVNHPSSEIIAVDDGSSDETPNILTNLAESNSRLRVILHQHNSGKGFAVKRGVMQGRGRFILFMDADNSTSIEEVTTFLPALQSTDIVIGSRYLKNSTISIQQPRHRVILGRLGNLLIQALLLEGIVDTQCGFKAFRHDVAQAIFAKQKIKRWAFDMEVLAIAKNMGYSINELPVVWSNSQVRGSRLRPIKDSLRTLRDLVIIKINLMTKQYHGR